MVVFQALWLDAPSGVGGAAGAAERTGVDAVRAGAERQHVEQAGQAAELHEDYDTAYEDYLKAHQKKP